ncbi:MAG: Shedu anti-phage system protein SduA domain-containing protein [Nocardioidaceae bacterium]
MLFGLEYSEIIPKFKLGKTFEMDFALQRHSGLVDLLEIEPSNLPLYTKAGNPTQHLVHAEQQVLDWLEWLETNARLARDDLPGLTRPIALVCIGSRASLSDADSIRLRRRNSTWNGTITILEAYQKVVLKK